jgi:hypothetical protein
MIQIILFINILFLTEQGFGSILVEEIAPLIQISIPQGLNVYSNSIINTIKSL